MELVSKAFTAAALAILVDERKLRWEDKATKYLPTLQLYDPYVTRELTVRAGAQAAELTARQPRDEFRKVRILRDQTRPVARLVVGVSEPRGHRRAQ